MTPHRHTTRRKTGVPTPVLPVVLLATALLASRLCASSNRIFYVNDNALADDRWCTAPGSDSQPSTARESNWSIHPR